MKGIITDIPADTPTTVTVGLGTTNYLIQIRVYQGTADAPYELDKSSNSFTITSPVVCSVEYKFEENV